MEYVCLKNELTSVMDSIHLNKCLIGLNDLIALMLSVLAALRLLKIGDANGAELALLGGPAVLLQTLLPFSGGVLLGADDAAVLVHEQLLLSETGGAVGLIRGAVEHLSARAANELVLLAVDVVEAVL
jgi:hypothetical protein